PVLEVGAGLGSLTVALAELGAEVLAVELDRALEPALREVVGGSPNVRILVADALRLDWPSVLPDGPWTMASNLPYNIAVPVVMELERREEPPVAVPHDRLLRVVDEGFAQRRKTMANALVRLGRTKEEAVGLIESCGADPRVRAESLSLEQFACLAESAL